MKLLLGQKIGMTQIWNDKGRLIAATVIFAEPNTVVKSEKRTQIVAPHRSKLNKAQKQLAESIKAKDGIWLKEATGLETDATSLDVTQFEVGDKIKISGVTKGKGFSGTIKRHNFHRGPVSHGSHNVRRPGSIGAQQPQRVPKGQKMSGRMGGANLTVRGCKVLSIEPKENLLIVSGAVPGPAKGKVVIQSLYNND